VQILREPCSEGGPLRFPAARWRRFGAELGLLVAMGAFMGAIGPYGSDQLPAGLRLLYWEICIPGG